LYFNRNLGGRNGTWENTSDNLYVPLTISKSLPRAEDHTHFCFCTALLAYLREGRGVRGPHLVIVPKSVVGNWIREFQKWCPSIRAVKMGGTKDERENFIKNDLPIDPDTKRHKFDVLVTSYEGVLKEKGRFCKIGWNYLIIGKFDSFTLLCSQSHSNTGSYSFRRGSSYQK
jgi:hypothetical protein